MSEPQNSFNLWSILVGAIIGAAFSSFTNLILRLWQYKRDNWLKRVDWFCDTLEEAADLGTEYWCLRGSDPEKDSVRAHCILGLQTRLDGLLATLSDHFSNDDCKSIHSLMAEVRDALTGGGFMSSDGKQDPDRARGVQATISDLMIAVRRAADASVAPTRFLYSLVPSRKPSTEEDWR